MRFLLLPALLCLQAAAAAGGGPETTLLVVNGASPMSRLVANEYAGLRDIPRSHLVPLDGVPLTGAIPLETFRERIWKPVAEHMKANSLEGQIDLVVYSVDLPYGVTFGEGQMASLTGVTFLIRKVEAEEPFSDLEINDYFAVAFEGAPRAATAEETKLVMRAQSAIQKKLWAEAAKAYEEFLKTYETHGQSWYNYACCLARMGKKDDAIAALTKAVDHGFADAGHAGQDEDLAPLRGLQGFAEALRRMREGGAGGGVKVKAKPSRGYRAGLDGGFLSTQLGYTGRFGNSVPEVLAALKASVAADGTSPDGTVYFCRNGDIRSKTREPFWPVLEAELKKRGRKVALMDSVLPDGKDDVIGAVLGTAGFSWPGSKARILPGAIVEHLTSYGADFAHGGQTKFSELVRFGAAGTSGTVMEPYALHQKFPNPLVHVFYADGCSLAESFFQSLWGPYQLMVAGDGLARPFAKFEKVRIEAPPMPWTGSVQIAGGTELWVDGRRMDGFDLDTRKLDDGWHDVRVVKVASDEIATRSYAKLDAIVKNRDHAVTVRGGVGGIEAKAQGAKGFRLLDGVRVVASSADGKFPALDTGFGPAELVVVAVFDDGSCRSEPLRFVVPPPPAAPPSSPEGPRKPGLKGTTDGNPIAVTNLHHLGSGKTVLEGWFEAPRDGFYEVLLTGKGTVAVAGKAGAEVPVSLSKGWHPIKIEGEAPLSLMLGGEQPLDVPAFENVTFAALPKRPEAPKGLETLLDGNRAQPGVAAPADGLILSFKETAKDVCAVTLFPGNGPLPLVWTVESSTGSKWLPVKDLRTVVARVPAPPAEKEVPAFVELSFAPLAAKKVRLVVKEPATLAEVEVLGLSKAKKK